MRPSEFEAIRPHLQEALDKINDWLKKQQEWEEKAKSWLDLPEDKRPKANLLTEEDRKALEAWERGTLTEEERKDAERAIQSMHHSAVYLNDTYPPWRHFAKKAAVWLRKVDWTPEADQIDMELRGLPRGPADWSEPENVTRHSDAIRKAAKRVKKILTVCLRQRPAKRKQSDGNGGAHDADKWIKVSEAQRISGINKGVISRAADVGEIKTNGKKGNARRLDAGSFSQWTLNRSPAAEPTFNPEEVEQRAREARRKKGVVDDD
jgi:hypothetical protein